MRIILFITLICVSFQTSQAQDPITLTGDCFDGPQLLNFVANVDGKPAYQIINGSYAGTNTSIEIQWSAANSSWFITLGGGAFAYQNTNDTAIPTSNGWFEIAVFGDCLSPSTVSLAGGVLPVEWLSFSGKRVNDSIELFWETASELNNDYFEIERSEDAISFEVLNRIKGTIHSSERRQYKTIDKYPSSKELYYRIKQVDLDGHFEYSDIIFIEAKTGLTKQAKIFPNPFSTHLYISNFEGKYSISTLSGNVATSKGSINPSGIDLSNLKPGFYILSLTDKYGSITQKRIIKSNK